MGERHKVIWHDKGREPTCLPNPSMPNGASVDFAYSSANVTPVQSYETPFAAIDKPTCEVALPYPSKRCGTFIIECATCGLRVACTTAGRPDDPRAARLPCKTLPGLPQ